MVAAGPPPCSCPYALHHDLWHAWWYASIHPQSHDARDHYLSTPRKRLRKATTNQAASTPRRDRHVRFQGPRFTGAAAAHTLPRCAAPSYTPLQALMIPYLGKSKIMRLISLGISTVEALAALDPQDRVLAMKLTKNSRPDLAVRTLARWQAKACRFLQDNNKQLTKLNDLRVSN